MNKLRHDEKEAPRNQFETPCYEVRYRYSGTKPQSATCEPRPTERSMYQFLRESVSFLEEPSKIQIQCRLRIPTLIINTLVRRQH